MADRMRAILDTSVVLAAEVPALPEELDMSRSTVAELHFGVLVAREASTRAERLCREALPERSLRLSLRRRALLPHVP